MGNYTMSLAGLIALVVQFVLPLVVGLVTKASWSAGLRAVLLLLLSFVAQVLVELGTSLDAGTSFDWRTALWSAAVGFVMAVAVHFGLWKPTGAADAAKDSGITDGTARTYR